MMKHIVNTTLLLLAFMLPATALAHDFEVDGIYYNINGNEATVAYKGQDAWSEQSYSDDVTIPATVTYNGTTYPVTTIGYQAFGGCRSLTSIDIPNSVTTIGNSAFFGCEGLTSVTIGNSVTTIGDDAFSYCLSLTSIEIPNSVTSIGYQAFDWCFSLTSIDIPNSVTTIGIYAFSGCSSLCNIVVANDNPKYDSRNNCNAIIETACNTLIAGCKNTVIPNSVTSIGDFAFYDCTSLTSMDIPNSVTTIGCCAFYDCIGLTSVTIPNSVTSIGDAAFSECSGLTSVTIPNSVTAIGEGAFSYCYSLASVTIPNSVTSIGIAAFCGCSRLNDVYSFIDDPATISMSSSVFDLSSNNYAERTLHVPVGTVLAYQADTRWSQYFGSIVEMEPVLAESIKLNVTTAGLNEGATLQLTATVLPEECDNKNVLWSSNDPSVATVDSNGLVTTHSVGTTTITAVTTDGSNLNASCTVTLLPVGVKGDMNGDGRVTITDVTTLIDYLLSGLTW